MNHKKKLDFERGCMDIDTKQNNKRITVRQLIHILIELPLDHEVYARDLKGKRIEIHLIHKKKDNELEALFG